MAKNVSIEDTKLLHEASRDCLAFWGSEPKPVGRETLIHPECSVMLVGAQTYQNSKGTDFRFASSVSSSVILNMKQSCVGNQSCAAVEVHVEQDLGGWINLLKTSSGWQCIMAAFSPKGTNEAKNHLNDFENVMKLCWNGYCDSNESCDGQAMAKVFHSTCRLTFALDDGDTKIFDQEEFCTMVSDRYKDSHRPDGSPNPHFPYRHLFETKDPRLSRGKSLDAIDFVTPSIAMVTLKIGHPPYLWTDFLTVACLEEGRWWIVHKTSCHEDFPITL